MKKVKLTLSVPENGVKLAKRYARKNKTTVSSLVNRFFASLENSQSPQTPLTDSLTGIAKLPKGMDEKELLENAILEKHLR